MRSGEGMEKRIVREMERVEGDVRGRRRGEDGGGAS